MPRAVRRSAPRRKAPARSAVAFQPEEPRVLTEEEKRELILAHAAARQREPREWSIGYVVGLLATVLVVVTGWAFTFRQNLRARLPAGPDPLIQGTIDRTLPAVNTTRQDTRGSVEAIRRAYLEAVRAAKTSTTTQP